MTTNGNGGGTAAGRPPGRAVFYHRDSGGRHETTPAAYAGWAAETARRLGVRFAGTPARMETLLRQGGGIDGDLYFDFEVKGNALSRPALDRLFEDVTRDRSVSHLLVKRRDRLARPDDASEGVGLEKRLRRIGVTIVYDGRLLGPLGRGPADLGEEIVGLVDYHEAGKFRRELAQKLLDSQLERARRGLSTGGRPPLGFRRWLADPAGEPVRELADGESVRMAGHHVVWLPGPDDEVRLVLRIVALLETTPASAVARLLTEGNVPSPHAGRVRKDRRTGAVRPVKGVWTANAVTGVAKHPLVAGLTRYGRRSMGDTLRFGLGGPRELGPEDVDEATGKERVVFNPTGSVVSVPAAGGPLVDPERHRRLVERVDARAATQRGKRRSRSPDRNPLGGRVVDLDCGWPMSRSPDGASYLYKCGLYQQSHGAKCGHNKVKGPATVRFLLGCLKQKVLRPDLLAKLEARLGELARREAGEEPDGLREAEAELARLEAEVELAGRNLARAKSDEEYALVSEHRSARAAERDKVKTRAGRLRGSAVRDAAAEVAAALARLSEIGRLAEDESNLPAVAAAFDAVNAKAYFRFREEPQGKRLLRKLAGGVVTFGDAEPPVPLYAGPTARAAVKPPVPAADVRPAAKTTGSKETTRGGRDRPPRDKRRQEPGGEADSLGNVNRDDRIRTCGLLLPKQALYQAELHPGTAARNGRPRCILRHGQSGDQSRGRRQGPNRSGRLPQGRAAVGLQLRARRRRLGRLRGGLDHIR